MIPHCILFEYANFADVDGLPVRADRVTTKVPTPGFGEHVPRAAG